MTEPSASIRVVWPFLRLLKDYSKELAVLAEGGIGPADLANPDFRVPHRVILKLLEISIEQSGDPCLGLHAGEFVEPGDFGPMEHAARSCPDLRSAMELITRYLPLLDDTVQAGVTDAGSTMTWWITVDSTLNHPAINDFLLATSLVLGRRYLAVYDPPLEVQTQNLQATNVAEYQRVFQAPFHLGAPRNAVVHRNGLLDARLSRSNPDVSHAFELQAERLLKDLPKNSGVSRRVRALALERLRHGDIGMLSIARDLHMSVATLRRRLAEEGTSHRDILDDVRRVLAIRHLEAGSLAVSEIAFLLGFSHVSSFSKAFRRWTGVAPLDYRARRK